MFPSRAAWQRFSKSSLLAKFIEGSTHGSTHKLLITSPSVRLKSSTQSHKSPARRGPEQRCTNSRSREAHPAGHETTYVLRGNGLSSASSWAKTLEGSSAALSALRDQKKNDVRRPATCTLIARLHLMLSNLLADLPFRKAQTCGRLSPPSACLLHVSFVLCNRASKLQIAASASSNVMWE